MKAVLHYLETNRQSCEQAVSALNSFVDHGWSVDTQQGYTPET